MCSTSALRSLSPVARDPGTRLHSLVGRPCVLGAHVPILPTSWWIPVLGSLQPCSLPCQDPANKWAGWHQPWDPCTQDPAVPTSRSNQLWDILGPSASSPTHQQAEPALETSGPCTQRPQDLAPLSSKLALALGISGLCLPPPTNWSIPAMGPHAKRRTSALRSLGLLTQVPQGPAPFTSGAAPALQHPGTCSQAYQELAPLTSRLHYIQEPWSCNHPPQNLALAMVLPQASTTSCLMFSSSQPVASSLHTRQGLATKWTRDQPHLPDHHNRRINVVNTVGTPRAYSSADWRGV